MWKVHVEGACGRCMWKVHVEGACERCMWKVHVEECEWKDGISKTLKKISNEIYDPQFCYLKLNWEILKFFYSMCANGIENTLKLTWLAL